MIQKQTNESREKNFFERLGEIVFLLGVFAVLADLQFMVDGMPSISGAIWEAIVEKWQQLKSKKS